jgi:regulatory protein
LQPTINPALAAAVKLLSERRYTKAGLAEKLRGRGYAPDVVDAAVGECERRRYIDDRTFAQLYVKSVLDRKAVGRLVLLQALLRQGVTEELADEVLAESDSDEDARIDRALAKFEAMRPQDGNGQLGRRLERAGFGAPAIARALRRRASARGVLPDGADFEEIG